VADGQGLFGLAKQVVPPQARFFAQTLLGDKSKPFTENDLTPAELQLLNSTIQTSRKRVEDNLSAIKMAKSFQDLPEAIQDKVFYGDTYTTLKPNQKLPFLEKAFQEIKAKSKLTEKQYKEGYGNVQYEDYGKNNPIRNTLGRFTYRINPDGTVKVSDVYDFYNLNREENVKRFEQMTPTERLANVAKLSLQTTTEGNYPEIQPKFLGEANTMPSYLTGVAGTIGEAYIGRNGRPVEIKYDPSVFQPPPSVDNFQSPMYTDPFGNTIR
jgi:hypothetical protein